MLPIQLRGLTKRYRSTLAVDAVDLDVHAGELFFLLGPSGCGKTTLLRLLAGLIPPTAGAIRFGDRDVTHLPANQRNAPMVFQGYALWPHLTVAQNVAFGLKVRRFPRADVRRRVQQALSVVQLADLAARKPNELSGGQQQRVALARALAVEPAVLLLDEPLSNLDAKLRLQMRLQIRHLCKQAGATAVYVTHDQKEALSIADRLAVMHAGHIAQIGTPTQLYRQPLTRFVADFIGESVMLPALAEALHGQTLRLQTPLGPLVSACFSPEISPGQSVTCCLRPESIAVHLHASPTAPSLNHWTAQVTAATYLGDVARLELRSAQTLVIASHPNPHTLPSVGAEARASVHPDDLVVLAR
jgi:iron(III) transport system ATP-binding protein